MKIINYKDIVNLINEKFGNRVYCYRALGLKLDTNVLECNFFTLQGKIPNFCDPKVQTILGPDSNLWVTALSNLRLRVPDNSYKLYDICLYSNFTLERLYDILSLDLPNIENSYLTLIFSPYEKLGLLISNFTPINFGATQGLSEPILSLLKNLSHLTSHRSKKELKEFLKINLKHKFIDGIIDIKDGCNENIHVSVTSKLFNGLNELQKQKCLWGTIDQLSLTYKEKESISLILPFGTDEIPENEKNNVFKTSLNDHVKELISIVKILDESSPPFLKEEIFLDKEPSYPEKLSEYCNKYPFIKFIVNKYKLLHQIVDDQIKIDNCKFYIYKNLEKLNNEEIRKKYNQTDDKIGCYTKLFGDWLVERKEKSLKEIKNSFGIIAQSKWAIENFLKKNDVLDQSIENVDLLSLEALRKTYLSKELSEIHKVGILQRKTSHI